MAGALKTLHAALRHLTWQTQRVASGDFSQRVAFMGEFSAAFNSMVVALEAARTELAQRNEELQAPALEMEELATHDPLTGVFNRRKFNARWGGEECVVLSPAVGLPATAVLAERLRAAVGSHPFAVGRVTASFGVADFHRDDSADSLFARADHALYRAKESGRDRVEVEDFPAISPRGSSGVATEQPSIERDGLSWADRGARNPLGYRARTYSCGPQQPPRCSPARPHLDRAAALLKGTSGIWWAFPLSEGPTRRVGGPATIHPFVDGNGRVGRALIHLASTSTRRPATTARASAVSALIRGLADPAASGYGLAGPAASHSRSAPRPR